MEFSGMEEFFRGLSLEQRVELYAIFGAIPAYLERVNPDETPLENARYLDILRFTPAASTIINLILSDIGRSVGHIVSNLVGYCSLVADTRAVLNTLVPKRW